MKFSTNSTFYKEPGSKSLAVNARMDIDPITGEKVDKASAIIGALKDGTVIYFESEKMMLEFNRKQ